LTIFAGEERKQEKISILKREIVCESREGEKSRGGEVTGGGKGEFFREEGSMTEGSRTSAIQETEGENKKQSPASSKRKREQRRHRERPSENFTGIRITHTSGEGVRVEKPV